MRLPADRRNFEEVARHPLRNTVFDCSNGTQGCQMLHPAEADLAVLLVEPFTKMLTLSGSFGQYKYFV